MIGSVWAAERIETKDLPEALRGRIYYRPTERGTEKEMAARLSEWRERRARRGPR